MKAFLLIFLFSISSFSRSNSLEGYKNPEVAEKSFFSELKKGSKDVDSALNVISGINEENKRPENKNNSFDEELKKIIVDDKQGKLVSYKMTSETVKMGGDMIKREYNIKFSGGEEKTILFIFYRPDLSGNYHIMDSKFLD